VSPLTFPPPSAGSGSGPAGRAWAPSTAYKAGDIVTQAGQAYEANTDFTSGASFNAANWTAIGGGAASVRGPAGQAFAQRPPVENYRAGQHLHTTFKNQARDEALFDFFNTQRVTDGTLSAIQVAAAVTGTGDVTLGSNQILNVTGGPFVKGAPVAVASKFPTDTTILDITGTTITVSQPATGATATGQTITSGGEAQLSRILSKQQFKHVDVRARYRPVSSTAQTSSFASVVGQAIRVDAPKNFGEARKKFNAALPQMQAHSWSEDVDVASAATNEDVTLGVPRWLRARWVEDAVMFKSWFAWTNWRGAHSTTVAYAVGDGVLYNGLAYVALIAIAGGTNPRPDVATAGTWGLASEPDWQTVRRIRPSAAGNLTGTSSTTDNTDVGTAGWWSKFITGYLYELSVTELHKTTHNLIVNSDLRLLDTVDLVPAFFYRDSEPAVGNTMDVADVAVAPFVSAGAGPASTAPERRKALHLNCPNQQSLFWTQTLFAVQQQGPNGFQAGRSRRHPMIEMPRVVEFSIWSKANSIANPSGGAAPLAASLDVYYYDRESDLLVNENVGYGTVTTTSGSASVTSLAVTYGEFAVGQTIVGTGIPLNTFIKAISGTSITLGDANGNDVTATASGTVAVTSGNYQGRNSYYRPLGPNQNGDGTWDWYETRHRLRFNDGHRTMQIKVQMGFHDAVTGELFVLDPVMRAVG
jgi:hypothetical protein